MADDHEYLEPEDDVEETEEHDDVDADATAEAPGDAVESLRELVVYLVGNLVDNPEAAEITVDQRGSSVHIQLELPEEDRGKVIGRGGRIAKAIRTVAMVAGSRHNLRVSVNIAD